MKMPMEITQTEAKRRIRKRTWVAAAAAEGPLPCGHQRLEQNQITPPGRRCEKPFSNLRDCKENDSDKLKMERAEMPSSLCSSL